MPFSDTTRLVQVEWVSYVFRAASGAFSCSLCADWLAVCAGGRQWGEPARGAWGEGNAADGARARGWCQGGVHSVIILAGSVSCAL